jgi:hypothetical protein
MKARSSRVAGDSDELSQDNSRPSIRRKAYRNFQVLIVSPNAFVKVLTCNFRCHGRLINTIRGTRHFGEPDSENLFSRVSIFRSHLHRRSSESTEHQTHLFWLLGWNLFMCTSSTRSRSSEIPSTLDFRKHPSQHPPRRFLLDGRTLLMPLW